MSYQFIADDADVILRASRCDVPRQFRVHKTILSVASPVFKDMFSMPQPVSSATTPEATTPVIDLDDTPEDLENFLCMVYPFGSPKISTLDAISRALVILDKYQVHGASLRPLRSRLVSPVFLKNDPIRVYSLACRWKFKNEADLAAHYTSSFDVLTSVREEDIQWMTTMEYHRILIIGNERYSKGQNYIRTTPPACVGCHNYKRFYTAFRYGLLEDFDADYNTFYDYGRCVVRCFEIAMEVESVEGVTACGVGPESHLGKFIHTLATKLSSRS